MLARDRMLSDAIIDFAFRCICNWVGDSYAMDSFAPTFGSPRPPATRISRFHFVVLPVHLNGIHWGVIMVRMAYHLEQPRLTPYYYAPLCSNAYRSTMEDVYEKTVATFLRSWHRESIPGTERSVEDHGVWIGGPKQPDGTSCGVLCIAHVYDMLNDYSRLARGAVTEEDVAVMRLRIMWMIQMQPYLTTKSNELTRAVEATDIELLATVINKMLFIKNS
ncbi:Ubiquitin carboxyl-terminal hydrolase [Phytophthora megakarya]|uniref:Ubiquitin carboxyl-terminal hydrolase n=1 Tax=Phytophthora megakarya TaxID=4795 RepID=A0A225WPP0_9STRA|nr:Ubiquitin carboxyl-terminal hydrolase [Phytophthora megakarya]